MNTAIADLDFSVASRWGADRPNASMNVRQMWKARIEGKSLPAAKNAWVGGVSAARAPFQGSILGIDPSLRGTGLAVVEFVAGRPPVLLTCRTVDVPSSRTMGFALAEIHRAVVAMLGVATLRHVALEQTIYVQNIRTAQILGAARGAAIAAASLSDLPIFEYPPLRVKQAVVGAGRASKEQVARTVQAMLSHGSVLAPDEADAAAVALCHAFTWRG
jgi:crossover junction endodeoxyribonuclease RuvC